jgi:DNA-binding CsgD family transcriptional regulator
MVTTGVARGLLDRHAEREAFDGLLESVRGGRSRVLVVRGEPGVGKTALLDYATESASGFRVVRAVGVESEMELPFAALEQLCAPMLGYLEHLPRPQQDALRVAFGLTSGPVPDCFLIDLAVLTLLSEAAEDEPLMCVVDDAQWLDSASLRCLAFVARRLLAEPIAMAFAVREPSAEDALSGLPELALTGLAERDARLLLASVNPGPVDEQVRDRILAETRGNPLALLELPRGLRPDELAGGFGLPDARPLASRIEQTFLERVRSLPRETQRLLLVAAAEPVGDVILLWRAAELLGIGVGAAAPAETAGLIEFGPRVRFRHPLVRSAAYRAPALQERQRVHRALAAAVDPALDPDRRAWHRAQAAPAPDETVAGELERSAKRAQSRGGIAAAAAFLERAAELTPDPARRGTRALAAAQVKFEAGALDSASELLATAALSPLDEPHRARLERLRARIAFARTRGRDAVPLLLSAAAGLEPIDSALARETYLEAMLAAVRAGRLEDGGGVVRVAEAARAAPSAPPARAIDLLLDALIVRWTEDYAAAAPMLEQAIAAFRPERLGIDCVRWVGLVCLLTMDLFEFETGAELSGKLAQIARDTGALAALPFALHYLGTHQIFAGEFATAAQLLEEANAMITATGMPPIGGALMLLAAWRGDRAQTFELREKIIKDATERSEGLPIDIADVATAVLHNGLGRYHDALVAARRASELDQPGVRVWALPELVEAATRSREPSLAARALEQLAMYTGLARTEWAAGIEARSRALLAQGQVAEDLYREAIQRLDRGQMHLHGARAHLLYGEWLRREDRRVDARQQLRLADDTFESIGANAFAERARIELKATGEHARKRTPDTRDELTPQEAQISRLAAEGQTNQEIAAQLFISASTVDYHLRKVFRKLGVKSRTQLARRATAAGAPSARAA